MFTPSDLQRSKRADAPANEDFGFEFIESMVNYGRVNKASMRGERQTRTARKASQSFNYGVAD